MIYNTSYSMYTIYYKQIKIFKSYFILRTKQLIPPPLPPPHALHYLAWNLREATREEKQLVFGILLKEGGGGTVKQQVVIINLEEK